MKIYIYKLVDPRNGEVRYVGKTNKPAVRLKRHRSIRCNYCTRKWRDELLDLGMYPKLEILEEVDDGRWHEREQYWIERLRHEGANLLNIATWPSPGPDFNHQVSEITRERLRKAFKGRPIPPKQRAQISQSLTGKIQSPESIAKRIAAIHANPTARSFVKGAGKENTPSRIARKKGHPDKFSPEWKAKIAASLKARYESLSLEEQERIKTNGLKGGSAWTGKKRPPMSDEWKQKIREKQLAFRARQRELRRLCLDA